MRILTDKIEMTAIDTVTLAQLREDQRLLRALRDAGVDNWEGYDEAMREFYGDE